MRLGGLHLGRQFGEAFRLTLAIWLVFVYGSYAVSSLIAGRTAFLLDLPVDLPAILLVATVAQGLYPVVLATADKGAASRWLLLIAATLTVALVQALVNVADNRLLGALPAIDAAHMPIIRAHFGRTFLNHVYISSANAALLVFLVEAQRSASARIRLAEAEARAARARAAALRLQLDPHFLFNALNSISSLLVTRRMNDADEMLGRLADFLRLSLDADPHALVRLDEEFDTIAAYLAIEAVRFGDRMVIELSCPTELGDAAVPGFILQPLVENAVKYGVARSTGQVRVRVAAAREDGDLALCVSDTGCPSTAEAGPGGLGIGLDNIRERLAGRYGPRGALSIERAADGFTAVVRIPYQAASRAIAA